MYISIKLYYNMILNPQILYASTREFVSKKKKKFFSTKNLKKKKKKNFFPQKIKKKKKKKLFKILRQIQ